MIAASLVMAAVLVLAAGRRPPPRRELVDPARHPAGDRPARHRPLRRGRSGAPPDARTWARYLDAVAAQIRGGTGVRAAAAAVADEQRPLGVAVASPLRFERLRAAVFDDPNEAVVVQSLVAALELGGTPAAVVQAGANVLRERAAVRAEALAHSAQARLSARVLTLVPLGFAAWCAIGSTAFRRSLLTPAGLVSAALGAVTNAIGWWWMRRVVLRAVV